MQWLSSLFKRSHNPGDAGRWERYRQFRELGRSYNLTLIKQLPTPALPECARKLGLYKAGTLILNQDDEIAVAYDYCLHHYRRAGKNIIERTRDAAPPAAAYLEAMAHARFSLFRVLDILPHYGARLLDLLTDAPVELLDSGLSSTGLPGLIVAGRLLPFDDFTMSSGILIPIPELVYQARIQPVIRKFLPDTPSTQAGLSPARQAAFEAQVLRIALHADEDISFFTDIES